MTKYTVYKNRGLWWVIDADGFEVSYVGHETKKEALEAARIRWNDDGHCDSATAKSAAG